MCQIRGSIVVSISACHAEDPGSIPGRGVFAATPRAHGRGELPEGQSPKPEKSKHAFRREGHSAKYLRRLTMVVLSVLGARAQLQEGIRFRHDNKGLLRELNPGPLAP